MLILALWNKTIVIMSELDSPFTDSITLHTFYRLFSNFTAISSYSGLYYILFYDLNLLIYVFTIKIILFIIENGIIYKNDLRVYEIKYKEKKFEIIGSLVAKLYCLPIDYIEEKIRLHKF